MRIPACAFVCLALVSPSSADARKRLSDAPPIDPCSILTAVVVKAHFAQASPEGGPGKYAKNMCKYSWRKPDAAAIEKANADKMQDSMRARMAAAARGQRYEAPPGSMMPAPLDNEVWLSVPQTALKSAAQASSSFDAAVKRLNDGITRTVRGHTITVQATTVPVAGVGDRAEWVDKQHELGVLDGDRMFWLGVKVHGDRAQNRAEAIALAKRILESSGEKPAFPTPAADDK